MSTRNPARTLSLAEAEELLVTNANLLAEILDELRSLQSPGQGMVAVSRSQRGQELTGSALVPLIQSVRALAHLRRLERYPDQGDSV